MLKAHNYLLRQSSMRLILLYQGKYESLIYLLASFPSLQEFVESKRGETSRYYRKHMTKDGCQEGLFTCLMHMFVAQLFSPLGNITEGAILKCKLVSTLTTMFTYHTSLSSLKLRTAYNTVSVSCHCVQESVDVDLRAWNSRVDWACCAGLYLETLYHLHPEFQT